MITDQLNVFTDNVAVRATAVSETVDCMPLLGKGAPIAVSVCVTEPYPAAATLVITVQESRDGTNFTSCGTIAAPAQTLHKGGVFSFALPQTLRGTTMRLSYALTGSPATGKLWAGVTRDTLEAMEPGQYANGGRAIL